MSQIKEAFIWTVDLRESFITKKNVAACDGVNLQNVTGRQEVAVSTVTGFRNVHFAYIHTYIHTYMHA